MVDRRRQWWLAALFAALAWWFGAGAQGAELTDVYEVRDVAVDVTAETAAKARGQALKDGERRAFRRLLERLTLRIEHPGLPELDPDEIAAYVRDFSVADEKTSAVRYLARLTYRFKSDAVRKLLTDLGFSFAETVSKPVLVLPVYQSAGALMLWDEPNPWREAWANRPDQAGLVPTILPLGDLADIGAIGAEQAIDGDQQRLAAIAERYGASDTLVAFGVLRLDAARGNRVIEVYFTRYGKQLREQTEVVNFVQQDNETVEGLLARAADELTYSVEDNWKRDNLLRFERAGTISAVVPIQRLADWLEVRRRLSGVAVIQRADTALLSHDQIRVDLHFIGETDQLALALEQVDLRLIEDAGTWLLTPIRAGRTLPPGAAPGAPGVQTRPGKS